MKIAMDNEQREKDYYLQEAKRSDNPVVIRLLETLAQEEQDHKDWIAKVHAKHVSDGSWPSDVDIETKDSQVAQELKTLDYKADTTSKHDDSDIACLEKAVEFEKEAADFYTEIAKACDNDKEKAFFEFLAKVEHDHQLSIQDSLNYLKDPAGWYDDAERHGLDGA
jgi:rubrerythrin